MVSITDIFTKSGKNKFHHHKLTVDILQYSHWTQWANSTDSCTVLANIHSASFMHGQVGRLLSLTLLSTIQSRVAVLFYVRIDQLSS